MLDLLLFGRIAVSFLPQLSRGTDTLAVWESRESIFDLVLFHNNTNGPEL